MRYVALGDSYTIGTSVAAADRWPDQLVAALGPDEPTLALVGNLGVNGYTTADLIRAELPALDPLRPGFVSVLIGVNDVVQGIPVASYARNVEHILDTLLAMRSAGRRRLWRSTTATGRHRRGQCDDGTSRRGTAHRIR